MLPKLVFSDFDGTLTDGEQLTSHFFQILKWCDLRKIPFIIVTGRSVQWAYFCLTHFQELTHFIAEGGGVLVTKNPKTHLLETQSFVSEENLTILEQIATAIKKDFNIELSADSCGRLSDRAIELSDLQREKDLKKRIEHYLEARGARHSTSSVHLNFWVGDISKAYAMSQLLSSPEVNWSTLDLNELVYFGDSLNDESVFKHFPWTVGVSNIDRVWDQLKTPPSIRLTGLENRGPLGVLNYLSSLK